MIQKHEACHTHNDLWLEMEGVLRSGKFQRELPEESPLQCT